MNKPDSPEDEFEHVVIEGHQAPGQTDSLPAWTTRMREGMARMANDEAERLKVARRLF